MIRNYLRGYIRYEQKKTTDTFKSNSTSSSSSSLHILIKWIVINHLLAQIKNEKLHNHVNHYYKAYLYFTYFNAKVHFSFFLLFSLWMDYLTLDIIKSMMFFLLCRLSPFHLFIVNSGINCDGCRSSHHAHTKHK